MSLWAVHLSDGVLRPEWTLGGFVIVASLLVVSLWRLRDEEIPEIALLTAAFLISSSLRIPVGPGTAHLLLNGLVGVMLGTRAMLAISVGLLMQCWLLSHGGWTALGVNACVIGGPALAAGYLFRWAWRWKLLPVWTLGLLLGAGTVLVTAGLNALVLSLGGQGDYAKAALVILAAHLPIAAVEGVVTGSITEFVMRVKPELLTGRRREPSPPTEK